MSATIIYEPKGDSIEFPELVIREVPSDGTIRAIGCKPVEKYITVDDTSPLEAVQFIYKDMTPAQLAAIQQAGSNRHAA
jgi:hypothetical protein